MQRLRLMMMIVVLLLPVSAWALTKTQVDTDSTQTLSGKTLADPIITGTLTPPLVSAFPLTPAYGQAVVITTDSSAGACDGNAGTALTLCVFNGTIWTPLGDGGGGSGGGWPLVGTANEITWANSFLTAALFGDGTNRIAVYWDPSQGGQIVCSILGVANDCDYFRRLNPGKLAGFKDRFGVEIFTITESVGVGTVTNFTMNVESSGNTVTTVSKVNFPTVGCQGTTGNLLWDTNATLQPTPTCTAGATNTTLIQGTADFPDVDGDYSLQNSWRLPLDWTGAIDLQLFWKAAATSGDVVWQVATMCTADAEIEDVAWNTADTFPADTAKGTTLQLNEVSKTGLTTTGCAPGELMHLKVFRNRTNGSDTIAGVVSLKNVEMTLRRAQ